MEAFHSPAPPCPNAAGILNDMSCPEVTAYSFPSGDFSVASHSLSFCSFHPGVLSDVIHTRPWPFPRPSALGRFSALDPLPASPLPALRWGFNLKKQQEEKKK